MTKRFIRQRCLKTKSPFHAPIRLNLRQSTFAHMPVVLLDDQPKIVFAVNLIIPMSYDHAAAVIQQRLVRFLCTSYLEDTDIYGQPFQLFCWVVVS